MAAARWAQGRNLKAREGGTTQKGTGHNFSSFGMDLGHLGFSYTADSGGGCGVRVSNSFPTTLMMLTRGPYLEGNGVREHWLCFWKDPHNKQLSATAA